MRTQYLIVLFVFVFLIKSASANESIFYKELNLIGGYSDREQWIGKSSSLSNSVGFEDYRKFSNDYGDYLSTDLQVRLSYDSLEDSRNAWAIQIHNAWLEYKLGYGHRFKLGHFDPAFGLESVLDTHGTILQTLAERNIGFNKDWGIAFKSALMNFDYELALQLGSGMSIYRKDGNYLFTSRLGSPATNNLQYSLSLLYGEVLKTMGMGTFPRNELVSEKAILKKRVGLDMQYLLGSYLFKGELAYGKDDNQDVMGYLTEINYTVPGQQNLQIELQLQSWLNDIGRSNYDDSTITLGASYKLNKDVTIRAAFIHDLNLVDNQADDKFLIQCYYYGN